MIKIENLSKSWGNFSLKNISFEVKNGEYFILLGESGTGKTLLLETIAGIYEPDKGNITINNKDITFMLLEKRGIGFAYQKPSLFPHFDVAGNIGYGLRRLDDNERKERVKWIARLLEIEHLLARKPVTLSAGEAQRVALARALAIKPSVLFLDEPLAPLSENVRKILQDKLKEIQRSLKMTVIHITHNYDEVINLGDNVVLLDNGKIIQAGTPLEIFTRPVSLYVANFVHIENIFPCVLKSKNGNERLIVNFNNTDINLLGCLTEHDGYWGIKAKTIFLGDECAGLENIFESTIESIEKRPAEIVIKAVVNNHEFKIIRSVSDKKARTLTIGQNIKIGFASEDAWAFNE
jgi:ABC-type Fe3+/spermidine/putrescine transport system ATPase subunit